MKNIIIFFTIIFLTSICYSKDVNPTGFKDINFGLTFAVVKAKLINNYDLSKSGPSSIHYKPLTGDMEVSFWENINNIDRIEIRHFKLGDESFTLNFYFNVNNKFWKFSFEGKKVLATYLDTVVNKQASYLSKVFLKKYGEPRRKINPSIFDIQQGYNRFFWKWWRKKHTIYTAISTHELEYYAVAVVSDDRLEKENENFRKKQEKIRKMQEKKSIDKAMDSF